MNKNEKDQNGCSHNNFKIRLLHSQRILEDMSEIKQLNMKGPQAHNAIG